MNRFKFSILFPILTLNTSISTHTQAQIRNYLNELPQPKKDSIEQLYSRILSQFPEIPISFSDGKNAKGRIVTNPSIGFGQTQLAYADGSSKSIFKVGISSTKTGISIYFMGLSDKNFLKNRFQSQLGKAKITGYCIAYKSLDSAQVDFLLAEILAFLQ